MEIIKKKERVSTLLKEHGQVPYLSYKILENIEGIGHGFSTRLGGVSQGIFSSMNLTFHRGDSKEDVAENFRRIGEAIGCSPDNMVFSVQTHTTNVRKVTEEDLGKGYTKEIDYTDVDGLITNVPGICLATFYADCVPLFFADPVKKAIGLSHSGWRGTAGKIGRATVELMQQEYGCSPENIVAAIGPSICQDCYEVSEDVIREFESQFSQKYWEKIFEKKENDKYQLDLWEVNKIVLQEAGIPEKNIALPDICTCCNPDFLFSHRASKGKRGNLGAFLYLKK